jgi:hypothetical protein
MGDVTLDKSSAMSREEVDKTFRRFVDRAKRSK